MHLTTESAIVVPQDWTLAMQCGFRRGAFLAAIVQAVPDMIYVWFLLALLAAITP